MSKQSQKHIQSFMIIGMLLSFIGVAFLTMIYMAKDNRYDNIIFQYFNISKSFYSRLIYLHIEKDTLANGLNLCSLLFILCNYAFSQQSFSLKNTPLHRGLRIFFLFFWTIQLLFYNTRLTRFIYFGGLGFLPAPAAFRLFYRILHRVTVTGNLFTLLYSTCCLIHTSLKKEPIRELRRIKWLLVIINVSICTLYFYMFYSLPCSLLWMSRSVKYIQFKSLDMPPYVGFMRPLPYIIILFIILLWGSYYNYNRYLQKMKNAEYVFSTIVASSEISTRAFSHYVKNELLGILSETDWILQNPEHCPEGLTHIRESFTQVYERLDILQKNSNRIVLNQSRNDILQIIEDVLTQNREVFEQQRTNVHFSRIPVSVFVFCDGHYIREVLNNLIRNALEAMSTLPVGRPRELTVSTVLYENEIQIQIADSGPGISPTIADRLFEPFSSTKPTKCNWGIGLSFVKRIVNSHNGKIEATNAPDGGAVFTMYFPILK